MRIGEFFAALGYPLHNARWSWGARSDKGVLLRTWQDDMDALGASVQVLRPPRDDASLSLGRNERIEHLKLLWAGGMAGYVVIARAVDPAAKPREIAEYDPRSVQAITSLFEDEEGAIWAELGDSVPVDRLPRHAANYRVRPSPAGFPLGTQQGATGTTKASNAAYVAQLPAMRAWLIEVAKRGGTVTYAEARKPFGMKTFEHRHAMDRVGHECVDAGEPILTSLIVDPDTGRCSDGFHKEFGRDDALERADCYAFWQEGSGAARADAGALREAARKFAQVELRPQQRAFRSRVFLAAGGACHVTGCRIVAALDAAHRRGRRWQDGHNLAQDGWLLRKDIHAMYDAGLLHIDDDGVVAFEPSVLEHYRVYAKG